MPGAENILWAFPSAARAQNVSLWGHVKDTRRQGGDGIGVGGAAQGREGVKLGQAVPLTHRDMCEAAACHNSVAADVDRCHLAWST